MPIYQYQCAQCGHQMEALQKISDARLTFCPECEHDSLRKQVTAAAFKLKGTGWYETDFKNSGKAKSDKKESPAADSANKPVTEKNSSTTSVAE